MDILRQTSHTVKLTPPASIEHQIVAPPHCFTWSSYVNQLHPWEQCVLKNSIPDPSILWTHLIRRDQQWMIISDGSYVMNTAAYAWIIHDDNQILHRSQGMAPGNPMTAFRSELYGVVTWYCCIAHILKYLDIRPTVTILPYTDNMKVIKYHTHLITSSQDKFPFFDDYDLYSNMKHYHHSITNHGLTIHAAQKIESKNLQTSTPLSLPQRLHKQADQAARQHRQNHLPDRHLLPPMDNVYLINLEGCVTSNEKQILETNWSLYNIEQYYARRWEISVSQLAQYDWTTYHSIYSTARPSLQVFIIKIMTGWLPVYHHVNKMTASKQYCHQCKKNETIAHLFHCASRQTW